jgi:hypothetical protein
MNLNDLKRKSPAELQAYAESLNIKTFRSCANRIFCLPF